MIKKLCLASVAAVAVCVPLHAETGRAVPAPIAKAFDVVGVKGEVIGTLKLTQAPTGVMLRLELAPGSLSPGWHGLHLHSVGDCTDVGTFKRSGGHVGMIEGGHGLFNPEGPEAGDLPNIWAATNGAAGYEAFTEAVTLSQGDSALLDEDGSALIIHAEQDDHISQPIGGAGGRVACAVIR